MTLHTLRAWLTRPDARIHRAERRFYDAYNRGGTHAPHELVIPIDWFARPTVRHHLHDWLRARRPLDLDALCAEWRAATRGNGGDGGDERLFFKNLAHYLAVLQDAPR